MSKKCGFADELCQVVSFIRPPPPPGDKHNVLQEVERRNGQIQRTLAITRDSNTSGEMECGTSQFNPAPG